MASSRSTTDGRPRAGVEEAWRERRDRVAAGLLLGIGLGGLVDGILLHQILQWHHMVSSVEGSDPGTLAGLEENVVADGLFNATMWAFTFAGAVLLWRAPRPAGRGWPWGSLAGTLLMGWGGFNLVDGLANHHLLDLHHLREGADELAWDLGWLAFALALVAAGLLLLRRSEHGARP